jgi:hypothetical protein
MRNILFTFSILLLTTAMSQAQQLFVTTETETGKTETIGVLIPESWVGDNTRNKTWNAKHTLVKSDEVNEPGNGFIIIQSLSVDDTYRTAKDVIAYEKLVRTTKNVTLVETQRTIASQNVVVDVIEVEGSVDGARQKIVLIPVDDSVVTLTLITDSQEFYKDHEASLDELLQSVEFTSKGIQIITQMDLK